MPKQKKETECEHIKGYYCTICKKDIPTLADKQRTGEIPAKGVSSVRQETHTHSPIYTAEEIAKRVIQNPNRVFLDKSFIELEAVEKAITMSLRSDNLIIRNKLEKILGLTKKESE